MARLHLPNYIFPWGRSLRDRAGGRRASEFVGREGERAFMIDALTASGPRGAYLVTGRRGVGKTSFVEDCLEEYEASTFKRFLRSPHGRGAADLFALAFFGLLVLVALVVASDFLEQLAAGQRQNKLLYLLIVPLVLLALLPMFYAVRVLKTVAMLLSRDRVSGLLAFIIAGALLIALMKMPPIGSPALSMSRMFLAMSVLVWIGRLWDAFALAKPLEMGERALMSVWLATLVVAILSGMTLERNENLAIFGANDIKGFDGTTLAAVLTNVAHGVIIFIASALGNYWWLYNDTLSEGKRRSRGKGGAFDSRRRDSWTFICCGVVFCLGLWVLDLVSDSLTLNGKSLTWSIFVIILLTALQGLRLRTIWEDEKRKSPQNRLETHDFAPPVEGLLLAKVLFLAVVSLHLLYPVFNVAPESYGKLAKADVQRNFPLEKSRMDTGDPKELEPLLASGRAWLVCAVEPKTFPPYGCQIEETGEGIDVEKVNRFRAAESGDKIYLSLFAAKYEELAWIGCVFLIIGLLFLVEYDWINRALIAERQSSAMGLTPRSKQRAHVHFDPVWIEETLATLQKRTPKPTDEIQRYKMMLAALGDDPHMRRVTLARKLERATFP